MMPVSYGLYFHLRRMLESKLTHRQQLKITSTKQQSSFEQKHLTAS